MPGGELIAFERLFTQDGGRHDEAYRGQDISHALSQEKKDQTCWRIA